MSLGLAAVIKTQFDATGINAAAKAINGFNKDVTKVAGALQKVGTALLGGSAIMAAASKMISFGRETVEIYDKEQASARQLVHQLQNMGITRKSVSTDLLNFAEQMEKSSKAQKEEVIGIEAALTSHGLFGEKLKTVTKIALDTNAALGPNGPGLTAIVSALGKAAEGNFTALTKTGMVMLDNIPAAQRFDAALKQLSQKFGGAALEETKSYSGQIDQLGKAFDDVKKIIGEELMPVAQAWVSTLKQMAVYWGGFLKSVFSSEDGSPAELAVSRLQKEIDALKKQRVALDVSANNLANASDVAIPDASTLSKQLERDEKIKALERLLAAAKANLQKEASRPETGSAVPTVKTGRQEYIKNKSKTINIGPDTETSKNAWSDYEQRQKTLAEFEAEMQSELGQNYAAFFGELRIQDARTSIERAKNAQEAANLERAALKELAADYAKAGKTIGGGWKQSMIAMGTAGVNWTSIMSSALNSFESSFASAFRTALTTAQGVFGAINKFATTLFQNILNAFLDLIAQMVAKMAMYGILNLVSGGAFGVIAGGLGKFMGWASGGYTGNLATNRVAGFVHGNEFVMPASVTSAFNLQGKSVSGAVSAIAAAGGGSQVINFTMPAININGGINSELDVKKVCKAIANAIQYDVKEAVYLANVTSKRGAAVSRRAT